tara:strand:+ start:1648 stop:2052 length:405 start_codon:yes stop_codon:yes gene_type:complete
MKTFDNINNENWLLFASLNYRLKEHSTTREFLSDLNITKYINRLFNNYRKKGYLKSRLCMNHIIVYFNVFHVEAAQRLLFFKVPPENWALLKMFLVFLNKCPEKVRGINGSMIMVGDIDIEQDALEIARKELNG